MTDQNPRQLVDDLRTRLRGNADESSEVPFEADRQHLLKMSDNMRLMQSVVGDFRQLKLLRHVRRMAILPEWPTVNDFVENNEAKEAGIGDLDDIEALLESEGYLGLALEYRAAAEAIVRWIHSEYDNEHTNQDYRTTLRSFGRYRLKRDEPPESLAWIPTTTSNDFNPVPSERDLLVWEDDVVPMIESCHNPRDRALLAVQFEAGCRSGELFDLRMGDIFDGEFTTSLHVDGKRGERSVPLVMSLPYLQDWVSDGRCPSAGDAYLWAKLNGEGRPSLQTLMGSSGTAPMLGVPAVLPVVGTDSHTISRCECLVHRVRKRRLKLIGHDIPGSLRTLEHDRLAGLRAFADDNSRFLILGALVVGLLQWAGIIDLAIPSWWPFAAGIILAAAAAAYVGADKVADLIPEEDGILLVA